MGLVHSGGRMAGAMKVNGNLESKKYDLKIVDNTEKANIQVQMAKLEKVYGKREKE